jgi:hypothetical protein
MPVVPTCFCSQRTRVVDTRSPKSSNGDQLAALLNRLPARPADERAMQKITATDGLSGRTTSSSATHTLIRQSVL